MMKTVFTFLSLMLIASLGFAQNGPITFEPGEEGADWTWEVFENDTNPDLQIIPNPDTMGANTSATVAQFTALQTGAPFAGCQSEQTVDLGTFEWDSTNRTVKIMVWKSEISDVGIKFDTETGWSEGEIKVSNTVVNEWEELTFDFSNAQNPPPGNGQLSRIVIFPDFNNEGRSQDNVVYFDNVRFEEASAEPDEVVVEVDAAATFTGFANVFETPANGGGFAFGSPWGVADIKSVIDTAGNSVTLFPNFNTYADNPDDPFWVDQTTGLGNKVFEGNTFVEDASLAGKTVTFEGEVESYTLSPDYETRVYIKVFNSDFSELKEVSEPLTEAGSFSITFDNPEAADAVVQYGFSVTGINANPADEAALGNVVIVAGDGGQGPEEEVVGVDASASFTGFANVFETPANGGGFVFGSPWGVADIKSVIDTTENTVTLFPNFNTYADNPDDPFWVDQTTGLGNKTFEGNTFVEDTSLVGKVITFEGEVESYTLSPDYETRVYIKVFNSDFSELKEVSEPLTQAGTFSITFDNPEAADAVVQYGFSVTGINANPADEAALGNVVIVAGDGGQGPDEEVVEVDPSATFTGFANVFETPANGGGFVFGSPWGVPDIKSVIDSVANTVILFPNFNTYGDNPDDPFWVDQSTGLGNKTFEGNTFVEDTSLVGKAITFEGEVESYTLSPDYETRVYIKVFNSDFSELKEVSEPLTEAGPFSITFDNPEAADAVVQYGFSVTGINANPADEAALGNVVIVAGDGGTGPEEEVVGVDANANFLGFANVFETPANGGGFVFGSPWGVPDIKSVIDSTENTVTLFPNFNTYGDNPDDPFWVDQMTGLGNKTFEGNTFVEDTLLAGKTVTFEGEVASYTLSTDYLTKVYIKVFNSDFSVLKEVTDTLTEAGPFSITFDNPEAADAVVQYGFSVTGINANPADEAALGNVVIVAGDGGTGPEEEVVGVDANANFLGFANVFETPANGGGFVFGSPWGVPDIKSVIDSTENTVTLFPNFNTYGDNPDDPFWVDQMTGLGNKTFEGNTFVEDTLLAGKTVTFEGEVASYTLSTDYLTKVYIKVFNSDFSVLKEVTDTLTEAGPFSITFDNPEAADAVVQYGFSVTGINANPADEAALGNVVIVAGDGGTGPEEEVVGVDANANFLGFANVFETPANGGGFVFGSPWGVPDIKSVIDSTENTVTLFPNFNTYGDNPDDPFWVDQMTGLGNKTFEGNTFVEDTLLAGKTVTFEGEVASYTLSTDYLTKVYIKVFNSDFSVLKEVTDTLTEAGPFSITFDNPEAADAVVQYGFSVTGINANPADEAALGNVVIVAGDGGTGPEEEVVGVDANANFLGFANVFETPANGGGFVFGSPWGVPDIKSVIDSTENTVTLFPNFNTYGDNPDDPFWVDQMTGLGNKTFEGNTFVEDTLLAGKTVTFEGEVASYTLSTDYLTKVYIKVFNSDFSVLKEVSDTLTQAGSFSITFDNPEAADAVVQYGFSVTGINANPADEAALGNVVIVAGDGGQGPEEEVVGVDASASFTGFANVFETPANGGGFVFGSPWGVADIKSVIDTTENTVTLFPNFNTYADNPDDPFWVDQTTGLGNKTFEGNTFVEDTSLVGKVITFEGEVESYTLSPDYETRVYIKVFNSDFSELKEVSEPLTQAGTFSITFDNPEAADAVVQYGFSVTGINANPADEAALGNVVIVAGDGGQGPDEEVVEVDPSATFTGFANVFETPANGGGFVFGSPWGVPDIKSVIDSVANTVILFPNFNTYGDNPDDPFWVDQSTGLGNKTFEGNTFVEDTSLVGKAITFEGEVESYTLSPDYE